MNAAKVLDDLKRRFPNEPEYHQAVEEVLSTIEEEYNKHPEFDKVNLIERLCIPDRVYQFRVTWMDDKGNIQTNMGYRVQHNNAIGPYKGGIRFHSSVNLSILKFLAFEQTFKNSLTTLPMGGGKGGSDFSPRGKSNAEVMRFVQAFMLELWRHIGPETDVPAGDIGVGGREVGFMFGMYKKLTHEFTGTFTGKGREFGGSLIRPEATGYGNIYFLMEMLKTKGTDLKGKTCLISGSGNVAQYTAEKVLELGISQISGGSRTSVGGYAETELPEDNSSQFDVSDTRTLDEVVNWLLESGHIPSFCTACYREGRTGDRFMSLVKSGQIANCCGPNALMTLKEYLEDYASEDTRIKGMKLIAKETDRIPNPKIREIAIRNLKEIAEGKRDFRF